MKTRIIASMVFVVSLSASPASYADCWRLPNGQTLTTNAGSTPPVKGAQRIQCPGQQQEQQRQQQLTQPRAQEQQQQQSKQNKSAPTVHPVPKVSVAPSPSTPKELGSINFNEYCQRKWGAGARLLGKDAYSWRCVPPSQYTGGVDLSLKGPGVSGSSTISSYEISANEACMMQYGRKATARALDGKNPYSWRCFQ